MWRRFLACLVVAGCGGSTGTDAAACDPVGVVDGLTDTRQHDVFTLSPSGALDQITDDRRSFDPAIAPDGSWIIFTHAAEGSAAECCGYAETRVRVVDRKGDLIAEVDAEPGWNDSAPALSADGSRIAFLRRERGGEGTKLMIAEPDGANQKTVADLDVRGWVSRPAWSPDSTSIVVATHGASTGGVLITVAISNGAVEPDAVESTGDPAFSADGRRLLLSNRGYEGQPVLELDIDTGISEQIPHPDGGSWTNATYGSDATKMISVLRFEHSTRRAKPQRLEKIDRTGTVVSSVPIEQRLMKGGRGRVLVGSLSMSRCFSAIH